MLGITRDSRIGMAQFGQFGTSIGGTVGLIMGSPFRDRRSEAAGPAL